MASNVCLGLKYLKFASKYAKFGEQGKGKNETRLASEMTNVRAGWWAYGDLLCYFSLILYMFAMFH